MIILLIKNLCEHYGRKEIASRNTHQGILIPVGQSIKSLWMGCMNENVAVDSPESTKYLCLLLRKNVFSLTLNTYKSCFLYSHESTHYPPPRNLSLFIQA